MSVATVLYSSDVKGTKNFNIKTLVTGIGAVGVRVMLENQARVLYRVRSSPANLGTITLGYDATNIGPVLSFSRITANEKYEDKGFKSCHKGDVYLACGVAGQIVIVEEVTRKR